MEIDGRPMATEQLKILCVHQGFELYGSDRSFGAVVKTIATAFHVDLQIVLPRKGPIDSLFKESKSRIEYRDLLVLRKADFLKTVSTRIIRSIRSISHACSSMKSADLTYVNTSVIADYLLAGFITRRPMVVHVREIPTGAAMVLIRGLLRLSGAALIFNSDATRKAFALPDCIEQHVVWNGVTDPGDMGKSPFNSQRKLRLLCIGRINSWKGQDDLVAACGMLSFDDRQKIDVKILGSVFEDQYHFLDKLNFEIQANNLAGAISIHPFIDDPAELYRWADGVIVPSRQPEPFGRVAIEAMAYGCTVIGTAHGGLTEIVENEQTGLLVHPREPTEIAEAIKRLLSDPAFVNVSGRAGRDRFLRLFTDNAVEKKLISILEPRLGATISKGIVNGEL